MLSYNISYWDLIKFSYFADTSERGDRGWKEAQRQGDDRVALEITLLCDPPTTSAPSIDNQPIVTQLWMNHK
jgi:hypothetical protein